MSLDPKYVKAAAEYLKAQLSQPEEDFVRFVGKKIYSGMLTKTVLEQVTPSIHAAFDQIVRDRIQDSLNITLREPTGASPQKSVSNASAQTGTDTEDPDVVTTQEELEGFMIVRAILARDVPVDRIFIRDAKSYCAILMDDNNRKPICRLYLNSPTSKYLGYFDVEKKETKVKIEKPSDIYQFSEHIETVGRHYLG